MSLEVARFIIQISNRQTVPPLRGGGGAFSSRQSQRLSPLPSGPRVCYGLLRHPLFTGRAAAAHLTVEWIFHPLIKQPLFLRPSLSILIRSFQLHCGRWPWKMHSEAGADLKTKWAMSWRRRQGLEVAASDSVFSVICIGFYGTCSR